MLKSFQMDRVYQLVRKILILRTIEYRYFKTDGLELKNNNTTISYQTTENLFFFCLISNFGQNIKKASCKKFTNTLPHRVDSLEAFMYQSEILLRKI